MPTLDEWQYALSIPRTLEVDSTDEIAHTVNIKPGSPSFNGISKIATGLEEFSPPRRVSITSFDLLHTIGRITTPRIENLLDMSSTWARIRYIWAFAPDSQPSSLRLSEEAHEIDRHQKALLSDEVGMGMAGLLIERYFNGMNPIDVDVAIRSQHMTGLRTQFSTSPDYLFETPDGSFIIVECKGTRSGKSTAMQQLKRGTEQVPSLEFPSGHEPLALVIGTSMLRRKTIVYIIDPPSKSSPPNNDPRKIPIHDEKEFREYVNNIQLSNLYLYAGATSQAIDYMADPKIKKRLQKLPKREEPPERIKIEEIEEDYLGVSQEFNLIGDVNRATIFQGLSETVYRVMYNRNRESILRAADEPYQTAVKVSSEIRSRQNIPGEDFSSSIVVREANSLRADTFGRDGTLLRIEISRG